MLEVFEYQNKVNNKLDLSKVIVDFINEIKLKGEYVLTLDTDENVSEFINEFLLKFSFSQEQIKEINEIIYSIGFKEELLELVKILKEISTQYSGDFSYENSLLISSFIGFLHGYANKFNKNYMVVKYDSNGKPTMWNKKMEEETGYTLEEVLEYYDKNGEVMSLLYKGENLEKVKQYLEQIEKTGKGYRNVAFTMNTKSGEEKTFLWTTIPDGKGGTIRTARHLTDDYEIKKELQETLKLLRQDTLTLALNRRALETDFKTIFTSERKIENPDLVFVILDIDGFKKFNDVYGHNIGDVILKELAKFILLKIRGNDRLYRLGGDEFVVVFETSEFDVILKKINFIRNEFFKKTFNIDEKELSNIGTSWGVKKINLIEMKSRVKPEEVSKEIEKLKDEIDRYMYFVKYMYLIEEELLFEGIKPELITQKNSVGYPVFDENGNIIGINILNSEISFFVKKEYLDLITERKILNIDKIGTREI